MLKKAVDGIRAAVVAEGRRADDVIVYGQALIVVADTREAAQAKLDDYRRHVDVEGALALLSGWTGIDFSRYDPDAVIEYLENDAGRTALASFSTSDPTRRWTVREAAQFVGLGGRSPVLVGSPADVADALIRWQDATGVDGFNLSFAVMPETFVDVVDLVVPELRRRGVYRTAYDDGPLRHQLFGRGPHLPPTHAGRRDALRPR